LDIAALESGLLNWWHEMLAIRVGEWQRHVVEK